jgi:hypothetical protein
VGDKIASGRPIDSMQTMWCVDADEDQQEMDAGAPYYNMCLYGRGSCIWLRRVAGAERFN